MKAMITLAHGAPLEIKLVDAAATTGIFSGYASVFGKIDDYGDTIMPGAFKNSIRAKGVKGIKLLKDHYGDPVGEFVEMKEDERGLFVRGQIDPDLDGGPNLIKQVAKGYKDGLSIGFNVVEATRGKDGRRQIGEVDLWETSIVTFPADKFARITEARSASHARALLRQHLVNFGLDTSEAERLAKELRLQDSDTDELAADIMKTVNALKG